MSETTKTRTADECLADGHLVRAIWPVYYAYSVSATPDGLVLVDTEASKSLDDEADDTEWWCDTDDAIDPPARFDYR
jgi:hypothetical protein